MKKFILIPSLFIILIASSCGPAAESREYMQMRAKAIADSMANLIRTAMAEAEMPANRQVAPVPDTSGNKTAPTATVLPPK